MKRINLLSEELSTRRSRGRANRVRIAIAIAAIAGVVAWTTLGTMRWRENALRIGRAQADLAPLRDRAAELDRAGREHRERREQAELIASLREPIPPAGLVALVAQLTPDNAYLRSFDLDIPLPAPRAAKDAAGTRTTRVIDTPIKLSLAGVSTTDTALTGLVGELTRCGVFRNVRLEDSRQATFNEHDVHEYRITTEVAAPSSAADGRKRSR